MIRSLLAIVLMSAALVACTGSEAAETPLMPAAQAAGLSAELQAIGAGLTAPAAAAVPVEPAEAAFAANGEFVSPSESAVAPMIPGRVAAVYVDEGARVREGQPLFALETEYLRLDVARAEAELARASAVLAETERDLARKEELRAKESIPPAAYDRSRAAHDQARAARAAAEAALRVAEQRLADAVVPAPFTGVVADR
ncbi:MAG: efflux RND transporter periplasmic adaptor subunit, partial [Thermoanaerobaculia bacterium]